MQSLDRGNAGAQTKMRLTRGSTGTVRLTEPVNFLPPPALSISRFGLAAAASKRANASLVSLACEGFEPLSQLQCLGVQCDLGQGLRLGLGLGSDLSIMRIRVPAPDKNQSRMSRPTWHSKSACCHLVGSQKRS